MIPFILIIMRYFKAFEDPRYPSLAIIAGFKHFWVHKSLRSVFIAHFILQFFFAWMVIYTPLYLAEHIGLSWTSIGQILFIGLMAYVLFEYFVGIIADRWLGEKELMATGFLILIIATTCFTFIESSSIGVWMFAMFMTRVGASFVEVTTESYFFKHTRSADTTIISFFRMTRPLSYVLGALLGSLTLYLLPFNILFLVLGLLMLPGFFFALTIKDTK
jgi:predicted MFS family arabinose efflux permease